MASKHKIKRIERVMGWSKASHKGAIIYFSKEKPEVKKSLKRKKFCKFTKGDHKFITIKIYPPMYSDSRTLTIYGCEFCGKKKWEMK